RGGIDQVRVSAHDQHRTPGMVLAPGSKAGGYELGGGRIDRLLALADLGAKPRLRLVEAQSREPRVDEIAALAERRWRRPGVERNDAVLDAAVGTDQDGQRTAAAQGHEAPLVEPQL